VEAAEALDFFRLGAVLVILGAASFLDWKTRKVGNSYWLALAILGLVFLIMQVIVDEQPLEYLVVLLPIAAILLDVYHEPPVGSRFVRTAPIAEYGVAIAAILILAYLWSDSLYFAHLLAVPVMMIVIVVFYMLDVVRGGADAKALISISIVFPFYPAYDGLPLLVAEGAYTEIFFPFSFVVLVTAAIFVAFLPVGFVVKNLLSREVEWPYALLGYKIDTSSAYGKQIWLMERMQEGRHIVYSRPKRDEDLGRELQLLASAGHNRVWVTPKIPFIPAILAATLFTALAGNLLLLIFEL
jgi:preflagellin peptidase FlaK